MLASDAAIAAAKKAHHKPKVIKDAAVSQTLTKKEIITIKDSITVKEFSEKSGIQFPLILKAMLSNKLL